MLQLTSPTSGDAGRSQVVGTRLALLATGAAVLLTAVAGCGGASTPSASSSTTAAEAPTEASTEAPTDTGTASTGTEPAAGQSTASGDSGGSRSTGRVCKASALKAKLDGGEGTAGTQHSFIALRNSGKESCVLQGYVGIVPVEGNNQLTAKVSTEGPAKPPAVVVESAASAWFVMDTTTVASGDEGRPCDPPAVALRIDLPQGGGSVYLAEAFKLCGGGRVVVHAFQAKHP